MDASNTQVFRAGGMAPARMAPDAVMPGLTARTRHPAGPA